MKKYFLLLLILVILLTPITVIDNIKAYNSIIMPSQYQENLENFQIIKQLNQISDKKLSVNKTIGEKKVILYEHVINGFQVKNDSVLIHINKKNGDIIDYKQKWEDTSIIIDKLKKYNFSNIILENYYWKKKVIFMDEKDCMNFYKFNKKVDYPVYCLEVRFQDGKTRLYDNNGYEIGYGITAPSEGFLLTGPHEGNDVWDYLRSNAEKYYSKWTDSITSIFNPYPSTEISPKVSDSNVKIFYEVAHGGSTRFSAHVSKKYYSAHTSEANVEDDMENRAPMSFAFIGSCEGMTNTGDGTFSYEFRKGQITNTVTVGYTGMGNDDGWPKAKQWQDLMFSYMDQGYTIKNAFDLASSAYPTIADAVKFVGDESYKITEIGNIAPCFPNDPSPDHGATMIDIDTSLSWSGGDANAGDTVTYDIYFGTDYDPPKIITIGPYPASQKTITYNPSNLDYNTRYYWKIISNDNHGKSCSGPTWYFNTRDPPGNNPPYNPTDPSPSINELIQKPSLNDADINEDGVVDDEDIEIIQKAIREGIGNEQYDLDVDNDNDIDGVDMDLVIWYVNDYIAIDLQIKVSDPDNDELDVGFYWQDGELIGTHENVKSSYIATIKTQILTPGESYCWYVEVSDSEYTTSSDEYCFTIKNPNSNNNPPYLPSNPSPENGISDIALTPVLSWSGGDPDDGDLVTYDVYFGTNSNLDESNIISKDQTKTSYALDLLEYNTTYFWKVNAFDNNNANSNGLTWSFKTTPEYQDIKLEINIPNILYNKNLDFEIENTGNKKAVDVFWNLSIKGFIFNQIDYSDDDRIDEINENSVKTIKSKEFDSSIGLVNLEIRVEIKKEIVELEKIGFMLGKILIILF